MAENTVSSLLAAHQAVAGKGLSALKIQELLTQGKRKNVYGPKLKEFMESDEPGINPAEVWPLEFGGETPKNPQSMRQSFDNAAKKAGIADQITMLVRDGNLFILHNERMNKALQEAMESGSESQNGNGNGSTTVEDTDTEE